VGGFGSGRPAFHLTCESALRLDLADPSTRTAINRYANGAGSWRWLRNGEQIAEIGYVWSRRAAELTLRYTCNGTPVLQTIRMTASRPQFGGQRFWFECPFTGNCVRVLYLPAGAKLWGSREAYRLRYQSQRDRGWERAAIGLLARIGSPMAFAALRDPNLLGLLDERRWERREEGRARRNEIRRIARKQRPRGGAPVNDR
jgi:hypothetical protein